MTVYKIFYFPLLLTIITLITGCAANLTPIEVSDQFWSAVKSKDNRSIKKYIVAGTGNPDDSLADLLDIKNYTLGRTVMDQNQAWVDTTVEISGTDSFDVPIKTVLLQENNQWKVDYAATVAPISGSSDIARVLGSLNDLGIQFADKLNHSLGEMQKALPEVQREIEKIEETMKQKLPELQQRMDELMQQLEEALGNQHPSRPVPRSREI